MKKKSTWQRVDELSCWVNNHHLTYKFSDQTVWVKAKGDNCKRNPYFIYVKADWTRLWCLARCCNQNSCLSLWVIHATGDQTKMVLLVVYTSIHQQSILFTHTGFSVSSSLPKRYKNLQLQEMAFQISANDKKIARSLLIMTDYYLLLLLLLALCQTKLFLVST